MADNLIEVGVRADVSQLKASMADAASTVRSGSAAMKDGFDTAKAAVQGYEEALGALGAAAESGNAQAAAIIDEEGAAAQRAVASLKALAAAERESAAASTSAISARQAATSAIGEIEGRTMSANRAAGAFLSTTLGLGPALQAAFPVIGALALLEVLSKVAGSVHKIYDELVNLRSYSDAVFKEMAVDEEAAVKISDDYVRSLRQQQVVAAELASGKAGRADAGAEAGANFDNAVRVNSLDIEREHLKRLTEQYGEYKRVSTGLPGDPNQPHATAVAPNEDQQKEAQIRLPELAQQIANSQATIANLQREADTAAQEASLRGIERQDAVARAAETAASRAEAAARKVDEANKKAAESGLMAWQQMYGRSAEAAELYWNNVAAQAAAGSGTQALAAQKAWDASGKVAEENKRAAEEGAVAAEDTARGWQQLTNILENVARRADEAGEKLSQLKSEGAEKATQSGFQSQESDVQYAAGANLISKQEERAQLYTLYKQEEQDLIQHLAAMQAAAQQKATALTTQSQGEGADSQEGQKDAQEAAQQVQLVQQYENQILAIEQSTAKKIQALQQQAATSSMAAWDTMFSAMNSGLNSAVAGMIRGTESVSQAIGKMLGGTIIALAQWAAQWLAKKAETYLLDAIYARTQQSVTGTMQVLSNAAVAASGAMAATAAIPIVGPLLAPAAGASMFAATAAFAPLASAAGGWGDVPSDQMAMIHKREMVLPASIAQHVRDSAGRGAGGGSGQSITQHFGGNTYNGVSDKKATDRDMARQLKRAMRSGALATR